MTQLNEIVNFDEHWYANADDINQELFRKWFIGILQKNVATVTFTKLNGEQRVMDCTLKEDTIPKTDPKENAVLCTVWDTQKNAWRSFRFDRIKNINYNLD